MHKFDNPYQINSMAATAFKPPLRMTVSEAAAKSLYINESGGYSGYWDPSKVPYMIEPMNMMSSRHIEALVFVGPARSGKTKAILEGFLTYTITCDNGNTLVVHMTKETAERYSKLVLSPMIYDSEDMYSLLSKKSVDDNMGYKRFVNGMSVVITHPSPTMLSAIGYRNVLITDFDRMDDSNGEGSIFEQAKKRTQNYMSRGLCMVESSPGRDMTDPSWKPGTPHEAPPTSGIISIYNRSTRKRWYWQCQDCQGHFEAKPGTALFGLLPEYEELKEVVRKGDLKKLADKCAVVVCPECGSIIEEKQKNRLNEKGVWLGEGQSIVDGHIVGETVGSNIAGYWLGGVAARYQSWYSMVLGYLQGMREYVMTGTEETLKGKINLDFGDVYVPRNLHEAMSGKDLISTAEEFERYCVPDDARLIVSSVDVQGGKNSRFVVQTHAVGVNMEQWIINRKDITHNSQGNRVNPANNPKDWDILFEDVVNASYRTSDGRKMMAHVTAIDTGGEAGTTNQAYQFYIRAKRLGVDKKIRLLKGGSDTKKEPITRSYGKDSNNRPLKEVPLYIINPHYFKDILFSSINYSHGIKIHFPKWLDNDFYEELKAEIKDNKGKYIKIKERNESIDLTVYIFVILWNLGINNEKFNWETPPLWAAPLSYNSNVIDKDIARIERKTKLPAINNKSNKNSISSHNNLCSNEWLSRI